MGWKELSVQAESEFWRIQDECIAGKRVGEGAEQLPHTLLVLIHPVPDQHHQRRNKLRWIAYTFST